MNEAKKKTAVKKLKRLQPYEGHVKKMTKKERPHRFQLHFFPLLSSPSSYNHISVLMAVTLFLLLLPFLTLSQARPLLRLRMGKVKLFNQLYIPSSEERKLAKKNKKKSVMEQFVVKCNYFSYKNRVGKKNLYFCCQTSTFVFSVQC